MRFPKHKSLSLVAILRADLQGNAHELTAKLGDEATLPLAHLRLLFLDILDV